MLPSQIILLGALTNAILGLLGGVVGALSSMIDRRKLKIAVLLLFIGAIAWNCVIIFLLAKAGVASKGFLVGPVISAIVLIVLMVNWDKWQKPKA